MAAVAGAVFVVDAVGAVEDGAGAAAAQAAKAWVVTAGAAVDAPAVAAGQP